MSNPTVRWAESHDLVGRLHELDQFRELLAGKDLCVLVLTGESGIGKTALANRLAEMSQAGALRRRFRRTLVLSLFDESWPQVLAQIAQAVLPPSIAIKATASELADLVVEACAEQDLFLVLDNFNPRRHRGAERFFELWLSACGSATMLVTTLASLEVVAGPRTRQVPITGLAAPVHQLELLGRPLEERFGPHLAAPLARLGGVPLSLLYLRWIDPPNAERLDEVVSELAAGTHDKTTSLTDVLAGLSASPVSFMALGVLRQLEFPESLIAFFWDRMGGGNTAAFVAHRDRLVDARLLSPVASTDAVSYRLTAEVHKHLFRALEGTLGPARIATVQFFAAEYYRRLFETTETLSLHALGAFVHHCIAADEKQRALAYVFAGSTLERLHSAGMALQLRGVLEMFLEPPSGSEAGSYEDLGRLASAEWSSADAKCRLLLQLAHVYADLSDFDACLRAAEHAEALVRAGGDDVSTRDRAEVLQEIWYQSAVAYSNTGESDKCLQYYFRVVASAPRATRRASLSLGYLAHDLKYRDLTLAAELGERAVADAELLKDARLLAKNLCSLGETYMYLRQYRDASACFTRAAGLVRAAGGSVIDRRELGRIKMNYGVLEIAQRRLDEARQELVEAQGLSASADDRRRVATGDLYLGITAHHAGDDADRDACLLRAIEALHNQGDGRYLVPAVFTFCACRDATFDGALAATGETEMGLSRDMMRSVASQPRFEVFAAFWRDHFRPVLLETRAA